jgi:DNA-binding HxlR family transcriptional regulator
MPIVKELPLVPAERALKVIGGRWKVFVLYHLFEGPRRLSELRRLIPDVSQKVLVQQLREMEEHGVVNRQIFAEVPPRVVYSATKLGLSLRPIVSSLCDWGRRHADELNAIDARACAADKTRAGAVARRTKAR